MDNNDVKFQIALFLESEWKALMKKAEKAHGPCPAPLKRALATAFWATYSPMAFWNKKLNDYRVINKTVFYVREWRLQKTYIHNVSLKKASQELGSKGLTRYKKWIKCRIR
jgi:hypothetical protein